MQELRSEFKVYIPVHKEYIRWFGGVLKGNLGYSYRTRKPIFEEILSRLHAAMELASFSFIFMDIF